MRLTNKVLPGKNIAFYLESFRIAHVVEFFGGMSAVDSYRVADAINGLVELGWTEDQIEHKYWQAKQELFHE